MKKTVCTFTNERTNAPIGSFEFGATHSDAAALLFSS
jgi:hypothetical protein